MFGVSRLGYVLFYTALALLEPAVYCRYMAVSNLTGGMWAPAKEEEAAISASWGAHRSLRQDAAQGGAQK